MSDNTFIRFKLVVLVIPVLCLSLLANNTTSVAAANSTIRGEVLYNDRPVSQFTSLQLHFLMRNLNSSAVLQTPSYNASTGAYSISNVPPGKYVISADTWWQHRRPFPGDFDGDVIVNVSEGQSIIEQNLFVQRIIHLTSPADNSGEIAVGVGPNLTQHLRSYPPGKIIFSWESLAESVMYNATLYEGYVVGAEQWSATPEQVTTTSDTKWEVSYLSPSSDDRWFELELNGYSSSGAWVGKLVAGDDTGYWFGFRFRISNIGQSSTTVKPVSGTATQVMTFTITTVDLEGLLSNPIVSGTISTVLGGIILYFIIDRRKKRAEARGDSKQPSNLSRASQPLQDLRSELKKYTEIDPKKLPSPQFEPPKSRPIPPLVYEVTQMQSNGVRRDLPSVGFNLDNRADYPVRIRVFAEVVLNGKSLGYPSEWSGLYNGKRIWSLNPKGRTGSGIKDGNFTIPLDNIRKDELLLIKVMIKVVDDEFDSPLPVGWVYDPKRNDWYYEPSV